MSNDSPPTTYDQQIMLSGFTGSGKVRSALVTGQSSAKKVKQLTELGTAIVRSDPTSFCAYMDCSKTTTPYEWCSQFARSLRTLSGAKPMALAKFAMGVGRSLIPFKPGGAESSPEHEANEKVISELVNQFETLTEPLPKGKNSPKLVIILDKFDVLDGRMLEWMSTTLNQAFRNSTSFQASRFIFSAQQKSNEITDFFGKFGFEQVHEFIFGGLANPSDAGSIEDRVPVEAGAVPVSSSPLEESNQTIELKSVADTNTVKDQQPVSVEPNLEKAKEFFSSYDDTQRGYITVASYAGDISRYTLEFFTDNRNAALCYNWLKRQPNLTKNNGSILELNSEAKEHARVLHAHNEPEKSEKWSTLSSVLDAFYKQFPDQETHWIPVNLQQLTWFNRGLIEKLFDDKQRAIQGFIDCNETAFVGEGSRLSLAEQPKLLTRRLLELSHLEPFPGLVDKAKEQWLLDSEKSASKRSRLENEKKNLTSDIEGAMEEISSLSSFKDKLVGEFNKPGSLKPERILSFSSSLLLIVIGLGTVGLSLLNESLGSYHAACGLGLTLFGFFWPTVELKRAAGAATISSSPLTLDAQQRSLEHRISNLTNRLKVMKGNIDGVDQQISKLGENISEPYVEAEE